MRDFPVVDISKFEDARPEARKVLALEVDQICRRTGFLAVVEHGVPEEVVERAWKATRRFFDLPFEKKLEVKMPYPGYPYGYAPLQAEALAKSLGEETPPDLKETFSIGPLVEKSLEPKDPHADFRYARNQWPKEPTEFREAWTEYYRALSDLAARIMKIFAAALDLREDFFEEAINDPLSAMRGLNYPHPVAPPKAGQLRAGAHSDYGSLTILLSEPAPGGLEIFSPEKKWVPVPSVAGAFVVNIGDLMARWTNDRWVSTLHRVINPPADASGSTRRQSIAFFHQPNWDAEIRCIPTCLGPGEKPKYAPVKSGEHLMEKFHSTVKQNTAGRSVKAAADSK